MRLAPAGRRAEGLTRARALPPPFGPAQTSHGIQPLLEGLLRGVLETKPAHVVKYLIDRLENPGDVEGAAQDPVTGLTGYQTKRLEEVFRAWDKDSSGFVDFFEVRDHVAKYGIEGKSPDELREVFREIDQSNDNKIQVEEFLQFFGRTSRGMEREQFDKFILELS